MTDLRIAVLGLGVMGAFHVEALTTRVKGATVTVVNDFVAAKAEEVAARIGARVVAGRDFHDGDRRADAPAVIVNEAFVRRFLTGRDPIGTRVRFAVDEAEEAVDPSSLPPPQPWLEIVGVVADIGMTPTDHGEAPYLFRATTPAAASIRATVREPSRSAKTSAPSRTTLTPWGKVFVIHDSLNPSPAG